MNAPNIWRVLLLIINWKYQNVDVNQECSAKFSVILGIRANERTILSQQHSLNKMDVTVQITAILGNTVHKGIGGAAFVALVSSVFGRNLKSALAVIGNISIGGAIERALNFNDRVSLLSENGAKNVIVPMDNLKEMATLPATILGNTDIPFYSNTQMLIQKIIL